MKIPEQASPGPRIPTTRLIRQACPCCHAAGQAIFARGDPADAIFCIHTGGIRISVVSELGKEAVGALLNPGQFFGERALSGPLRRVSTATCLTLAVISRIDTPDALYLIRHDPAFRGRFLTHLLHRSIRIEADLADQLSNPSEKRLARLLLLLGNGGTDDPPQPVTTNVGREMLAQMIGTTRARVSLFMNHFRALGSVSCDGQIMVHGTLLTAVLRDRR